MSSLEDKQDKQRKHQGRYLADGIEKSAIEGAAAESIQRFGSAAKQHFVAYSGVDNESGQELTKGLKAISEYAVSSDPHYYEMNINQQAGFSAEVKAVARQNAQKIINGDRARTVRTDDLGSVNDPLYDLVEVDASGEKIPGTAAQMKFVGRTPEDLLTKLNSSKCQKYIDAEARLIVPDNYYNELMGTDGDAGLIDQRIEALKKQVEATEKNGKLDVAASKREQIQKYEKIKKNLRKAGMTRKVAREARMHPELSTCKDVFGIAHEAGTDQAKYGAIISGSVSIIKNMVACVKGEKTPGEAAQAVALDTGKGAAVSYATAFAGSTIKGAMQNAGSNLVRSLSNTNLAAGLVTTTLNVSKTMHRFFAGEIEGTQCIEQNSEKGVGEIGSAIYASIGVAATRGGPAVAKILGGIAGATFGYAAAVAVYQELSTALQDAKIAREERIRIEIQSAEAIQMIRRYREEMESLVSDYMANYITSFNEGFDAMDSAIMENDIEGFLRGNAQIQAVFGRTAQFSTQVEFDELMDSDIPLKL